MSKLSHLFVLALGLALLAGAAPLCGEACGGAASCSSISGARSAHAACCAVAPSLSAASVCCARSAAPAATPFGATLFPPPIPPQVAPCSLLDADAPAVLARLGSPATLLHTGRRSDLGLFLLFSSFLS